MNLKETRAAALTAAQELVDGAKGAGRELTAEEQSTVEAKFAEIEELDTRIERAAKSDSLMQRLTSVSPDSVRDREQPAEAKSLGEHFIKTVGNEGLSRVKTISGATIAAPAWEPQAKAATDTQATPSSLAPWLTTYDQTIVRSFRRPVISDLLGSGTIGQGSNAITYLVEGAVEGAIATVGEGGAKPQFHIADPTPKTDAIKKLAGFLRFTDEMAEDAAFWISEINQRGIYLLALAEENQLLNGDGLGANIEGLLTRSGIQTEAAADNTDNAEALYRAISNVQTATGLSADGIVINPADYQKLRLNKDGNGQYFGGGYFQGQYGNSGVEWQPSIWGLRTVVSAAVPVNKAIVGAFNTAASVYRKGGVRVESTNSHADDFTNNLITTRIEERVGLAVRIPGAFVNVTLSDTAAPVA